MAGSKTPDWGKMKANELAKKLPMGVYDPEAVLATVELAKALKAAKNLGQLKAALAANPKAYPKFVGIVSKAWASDKDPVIAICEYIARKSGRE